MQAIQLAIASAVIMGGAMITWVALARSLDLLDRPDGVRKQHSGAIPLVGGPALLSVLTITGLALPSTMVDWRLIFIAAVTTVIGSLDDRFDLSALLRLAIQLLLGTLVVLFAGYTLIDLGRVAANGAVFELGPVGPWITIAAIAAAMNAFNMLDGTDGQTAGVALIALTGLIAASALAGSAPAHLLIATASALPIFLIFNMASSKGRLPKSFLGDSGAMLLGLVVGTSLVSGAQGDEAYIKPVTALWLAALPLFDTFFVMGYRTTQGRSPLSADRNHVHHLLIDHGLSRGQALATVLSSASLLALAGLSMEFASVPEVWSFAGILVVFICYVGAALSAHRKRPAIVDHLQARATG